MTLPLTGTPRDQQSDDDRQDLAHLLRRLADDGASNGLTVAEIRDRLDERAYGLLVLILAIPCLVPGLYGVPQVVGLAILILAFQLLLGREEPWLPRWFLNLRARASWLEGMADFTEKRLGWLERLSRPRLKAFSVGPGERFAAIFMILSTLTIVLPMTNTIPSVALTLLAVGLIQRDGLFVLGGAAVATAWLGLLTAVGVGLLIGADWALRLMPGM
ncbi:MAG: exopolysaccharide biosynthesis protein exod [Alphaproteobacteria bacterium]|nr:MAG: exopolysaccharide biosynthesis protein exod [Alphaproteobacteria bacterium]PZO37851.1 MAG: exopolysaccharide biosynthesis protein exod [Alphaproteobacteria bacterium]